MRIYEIQAGKLGPEIDQQLQGVGNGINQQNNQPQQPETPPAQPDMKQDDSEEEQPKKVDPYLVAAIKGMPYVNEYDFDESNKIAPYNLLQRSYGELIKIRNLIRAKINMKTMSDQYGLYDDPSMKFFQDMISFIEQVMTIKKKADDSKTDSAQKVTTNNPAPQSNVR
jgi:hypothetical protein